MVGYVKMIMLFGNETRAGDTLQRSLFSKAFRMRELGHFYLSFCQGISNEIDNYAKIVAHKKMDFGVCFTKPLYQLLYCTFIL
jgi:hypothetical protein